MRNSNMLHIANHVQNIHPAIMHTTKTICENCTPSLILTLFINLCGKQPVSSFECSTWSKVITKELASQLHYKWTYDFSNPTKRGKKKKLKRKSPRNPWRHQPTEGDVTDTKAGVPIWQIPDNYKPTALRCEEILHITCKDIIIL